MCYQLQNVLIVEDIIDSGLSMTKLCGIIENLGVGSLRVASLFIKRNPINKFKPDFVGFELPMVFVVGCNLDYNEYFRDLDHLCVLNESARKKYLR